MNRIKTSISVLGATAMALSLAACGGDSGSDEYCDLLTSTEEKLSGLTPNPSDPDSMSEMSGALQEVADAAPDDIKGDWEKMTEAFEKIADIDLTNPDPSALEALSSDDLTTASENITKHAKEECGVDMG